MVLVQGMPQVHMQPLVALALVGLLRMCADTYVSAELAANGQAAAQHSRHLSNVLMRLRASVDPDASLELSSDLQVRLARLPTVASLSFQELHGTSSSAVLRSGFPRRFSRMGKDERLRNPMFTIVLPSFNCSTACLLRQPLSACTCPYLEQQRLYAPMARA